MRATPPPNRLAVRARPRRGWVWALLAVAALAVLLIVATPYGLRYGLERWLYRQGAQTVQVGDVRINPFNGDIQLSDLQLIDRHGRTQRAAGVQGRFLWQSLGERRLMLGSLTLRDADLSFGPESRWLRSPWPMSLQQLKLHDVTLHWDAQGRPMQLHIADASLGPWANDDDQPTPLSLRGRLAGAPLRLQGNVLLQPRMLPQGNLHLELDDLELATLVSDPGLDGRVTVNVNLRSRPQPADAPFLSYEGTLRIADLAVGGAATTLQSSSLAWAGDGTVQQHPRGLDVQQQGRLTMSRPQLRSAAGQYAAAGLEWHGHLRVAAGAGPAAVSTDGALDANAVSFIPADSERTVNLRRLQWKGVAGYGTADVPGGLAARGSAHLDDLQLAGDDASSMLFSARRLNVRELDLKGTYLLQARTLQLDDFRALAQPNGESLMSGAQATLEQVTLKDRRRFEAQRLQLRQARLLLRKQSSSGWNAALPGSAGETPDQASPGSWRIGRIELQDRESILRFEQYALSPPLTRSLTLHKLVIGEMDTSRPQQPTPIALHGRDDQGARIVAVGKVRPFAAQTNLELKTKLTGIRLSSLSPYAAQLLGYRTEAGVASLTSDLHVIDDQLRSDNELQIRGLRLRAASSAPKREVRQGMTMPLPVAVDLLQESDRDLHLSVPVRHDLSARQPLSDGIQIALGQAVQQAAIRVARNVLHPFLPADADTTGLRLEPLRFRAGSHQLDTVARTYLRRIAALMRQRPALRLAVCAKTTAADGAAIADRRNARIVATLANEFRIDEQRIDFCTEAPGTAAGTPRAELTLQ